MIRFCCVSASCCCLNCCFKELTTCCGGLFGKERIAKLLCIILDILIIVPGIFIFFFLQDWADFANKFGEWIKCPKESGEGLNCFGISAVYRLSMALLMLYILITFIMICRNRLSKVVNEGLFFIKYILVVGAFIGLLFVPNSVFMTYGSICKIVGLVFLVLQSIILIDLFYMWGIYWIKRYQNGQRFFGFLLIFFSLCLYSGAIALNVFSYLNFGRCHLWLSITTSVLILLIPCTQLFNFNPQNSLLATSCICLYISYLSFIALYSAPSCGVLSQPAMISDISISTVLFFITMFGSVMGGSGVIKANQNVSVNQVLGVTTQQPNNPTPITQNDQTNDQLLPVQTLPTLEDSYQGWDWVKWYIYMCIASMYIGMLITNWGSPEESNQTINSYVPNWFSFWSRVCLGWVTSLLYVWTLIAPKIFPSRNWEIQ